jgi:hypothetical protein
MSQQRHQFAEIAETSSPDFRSTGISVELAVSVVPEKKQELPGS